LNVTAAGSSPFTYQWQLNGQNISGATLATYTRSNFQTNHEGQYRVVVSNGSGSMTSEPAVVLLNAPARIIWRMETPTIYLRLIGPTTSNFVLQSSTDLNSWTGLFTNAAMTGVIETNVAVSPSPARYYRFQVR
jgi:hypothetical protein